MMIVNVLAYTCKLSTMKSALISQSLQVQWLQVTVSSPLCPRLVLKIYVFCNEIATKTKKNEIQLDFWFFYQKKYMYFFILFISFISSIHSVFFLSDCNFSTDFINKQGSYTHKIYFFACLSIASGRSLKSNF